MNYKPNEIDNKFPKDYFVHNMIERMVYAFAAEDYRQSIERRKKTTKKSLNQEIDDIMKPLEAKGLAVRLKLAPIKR